MNLPSGQLRPPRIVDTPGPLRTPKGQLRVFGAGRNKLAAWTAAVLGAAGLTLAAWLRLPGLTRGTLWAEDGGVFLRQALGRPFLTGILDPYDGYLHLLPRGLAHLSLRTGPLEAYAERITNTACALFTNLWMLLLYARMAHWVWSPGFRLTALGALDFAGGTVVHMNSGFAALAAAIVIGKRRGFLKEAIVPHNLTLTILGAGILWFEIGRAHV